MTSRASVIRRAYNGWTNYETWVLALWLGNDEQSQHYWQATARLYQREAPADSRVLQGIWTAEEAATFNLTDQLKEEFHAGNPLIEASVYADLLLGALSEVDWREIASNILDGAT